MNTSTPLTVELPVDTNRSRTPLLDHGEEDGMASDASTANKLSPDQQLARFLQWLQFTDRGHQPC